LHESRPQPARGGVGSGLRTASKAGKRYFGVCGKFLNFTHIEANNVSGCVAFGEGFSNSGHCPLQGSTDRAPPQRHRVPLTGLLPVSGEALTAHNAVIPRRMAELPASHAHLRHRVPLTGLLPASGQALTAHNAVIANRRSAWATSNPPRTRAAASPPASRRFPAPLATPREPPLLRDSNTPGFQHPAGIQHLASLCLRITSSTPRTSAPHTSALASRLRCSSSPVLPFDFRNIFV